MSLLDLIPGYREAVTKQEERRQVAFLNLPYPLCGIQAEPLTLHRMLVLQLANNPFICGGTLTREAVAAFLWIVSKRFRFGASIARESFLARLAESPELDDLAACVDAINGYLDEQFQDAPARTSSGCTDNVSHTGSESVWIDLFADAYGWTDEVTMHLPLPQMYQILRARMLRLDPKAILISPSDRVRGEWIRSQPAFAVHHEATEVAAEAALASNGRRGRRNRAYGPEDLAAVDEIAATLPFVDTPA